MRRLLAGAICLGVLIGGHAAPTTATTTVVDCGDGGDDLIGAVAAAVPGDTLVVRGRCAGPIVIERDLKLIGDGPEPRLVTPLPTLPRILHVQAGSTVRIVDLAIDVYPRVPLLNDGKLILRRSSVSPSHDPPGGSIIENNGTLRLHDSFVGDAHETRGISNRGKLLVHGSTIAGAGVGNDGSGSAIHNEAGATAELVGALIERNGTYYGGGGGLTNAGSMTIRDSVVRHNSSGFAGAGGIANWGTMTIVDSKIAGNWNQRRVGAGIDNIGDLVIRRSVMKGNIQRQGGFACDGDAWHCDGGGLRNAGGTVLIEDSVFKNNSANEDGGGIWNDGKLTIRRSRIEGNIAGGDGGGIRNVGRLKTRKVRLIENVAAGTGGGVLNTGIFNRRMTTFGRNVPNACDGC